MWTSHRLRSRPKQNPKVGSRGFWENRSIMRCADFSNAGELQSEDIASLDIGSKGAMTSASVNAMIVNERSILGQDANISAAASDVRRRSISGD